MIIMRRGSGDHEPAYLCAVCHEPVTTLSELVGGFAPPAVPDGHAEVLWFHEQCTKQGILQRVFGGHRAIFWRGEDLLQQALTPMVQRDRRHAWTSGKYDKSGKAWHA
jgi:hypothetical protein